MHTNEALIHKLYSCFQNKDYAGMQSCYANNAVFSDPVFQNLNAAEVKAMWKMFCINGRDLHIEFNNVKADDNEGTADWTARYTFSATGASVVNRIHAHFVFQNGLIAKHTDRFSFYDWSRQAFGISGTLLGWASPFKQKVRRTATQNLKRFMKSNPED